MGAIHIGKIMPSFLASRSNLKSLKDQIRQFYDIPSGHLSEALASALGFNTNAALLAKIDVDSSQDLKLSLSDEAFTSRLIELNFDLPDWKGFSRFQSAFVILGEGESYRRIDLKKTFSAVWNLVIFPDFSRVESGKDKPPYVDHNKVDFEKIRNAISEEFRYGSPVNVRIGNDTIDQTVVHLRGMGLIKGPIDCEDFCTTLLKKSKQQSAGVIDIRRDWNALQYLKNRREAPPPIMIPILIEAIDAEDAILWGQQAQMVMGVKKADIHYLITKGSDIRPEDSVGSLPERLRKVFFEQFNIRYEKRALLTVSATDPRPSWMKR
jgi:hypothetical protein